MKDPVVLSEPKNKLQVGKFVKGNGMSVTFLLVCRNLPGKANLKIRNFS